MVIPPGYVAFSLPLRHNLLARQAFITGGVKKDTPENDASVLATLIQAQFFSAGSFLSRLDNTVTAGPLRTAVGQDGADPILGVAASTAVGGLVMVSFPPNVAVLVRKTTNLGGRLNRGRFYIPWFVDEAGTDEVGLIDTPNSTAIQSAMNTLRTNLSVANVPMVVLHSTSVATPGLVTALTADRLVATQRRRLGR
jgi:hypothetical protein